MSHYSVATSNLGVQEIVGIPRVQCSDRNIDALGVLVETTSSNNPKSNEIGVVPKMQLGDRSVVVPVVWQSQVPAPWTILLLVGQGLVRPLAVPGREVSQ